MDTLTLGHTPAHTVWHFDAHTHTQKNRRLKQESQIANVTIMGANPIEENEKEPSVKEAM